MKRISMILALVSTVSFALEYKEVETKFDSSTRGAIQHVEILGTKVTQEGQGQAHKNLDVELGIQAEASVCESVSFLEQDVQSGLKPNLPSDHYLRLKTHRRSGCFTGSSTRVNVKASLQFSVLPGFEPVHYLSFDAGMVDGHNRWRVYRINFKDLSNVRLEYVKTVSFIEGQAVEKPLPLSIG